MPPNHAHYRQSSRLLAAGFRHAFFTRHGGVSEGPFATLNFSRAVGDDPAKVQTNLERAADALGVALERLYFLSQVHGNNVCVVDGSEQREAVLHWEGDAIETVRPGVACAVRVADCIPILIADPKTGAVGAVHAGWRGIVADVIGAAVERLRKLTGRGRADAPGFVAAIGPHIGPRAFEVGREVAEAIARASPVDGVVDDGRGERPYVDLGKVARAQLEAAGLATHAIDQVAGCTVSDTEFFSYRRDGKRSGRHLAAIVARDGT